MACGNQKAQAGKHTHTHTHTQVVVTAAAAAAADDDDDAVHSTETRTGAAHRVTHHPRAYVDMHGTHRARTINPVFSRVTRR